MPEIYLLTLIIGLAAGLGILVKRFKQPLLVSYIAIGAVLSATHIVKPEQLKFLAILPEIGLAFLLFLVGMELDLREFRSLGKNVVLATIGQLAITTILAVSVGVVLGLPVVAGVLVGLAVGFSSTILVIKLLLEGRDFSSIYGKLSIGILLVEDLLAIVVLMLISVLTNAHGGFSLNILLLVVAKGLVLMGISLLAGKKVLPRIFAATAENSELMFLTAIAWCLLFVCLSVSLGFSLAIGAFLAGVSLAQSVYRIQISGKIKPLRDFFIMIFFLDLGTGLSLSGLSSMWMAAVGILVYAVVLKPIIFFLLFTAFKFRAHSAFRTAILLSSISEFSLILVTSASKQGLMPPELVSPFIFATVFSFVFSSVMVTHGRSVYLRLKSILKKFEEKETISFEAVETEIASLSDHAVLVGCHRSGEIILPTLQKQFNKNLVVLDFNPEVISRLRKEGIICVYGDASDMEIQEKLNFQLAKLIVSTTRDLQDNLAILDGLLKTKSKAIVVVTASDVHEALRLYEKGADFVSLPMSLEGANISHLLKANGEDLSEISKERDKRVDELKKMDKV